MDAILDEIDEVLEENAEEFVRSYVQKAASGGARRAAPGPRPCRVRRGLTPPARPMPGWCWAAMRSGQVPVVD